MFPDYHGPADHWDKIDYANMAKIDRMVARGLLMIAEQPRRAEVERVKPQGRQVPESLEEAP